MKQTWRWFGPSDAIGIRDIRQTGAQGIVTGLHHFPPGQVWTKKDIQMRQSDIAHPAGIASGLAWDVVESLPVSEAIKSQTGQFSAHLAAYKESLKNLASCGIKTVCYNFMPVLDWTRTDLAFPLSHGGTAMRFDLTDFAVFDCFLLRRYGAQEDYDDETYAQAVYRFSVLDDPGRAKLISNIVAGLPGANNNWTLDDVRSCLAIYRSIDAAQSKRHLVDFLSEVVPTAKRFGVRLCCHPDDPPFPVLGLPRIMSSQADYSDMMKAVDDPANGITFCTGSLGVDPKFNPVDFIQALGDRIHFVHLRNTIRDSVDHANRSSFVEAEHLTGDTDMIATVRALMSEERKRKRSGRADYEIPMRPDHGHCLLDDFARPLQPGYPLIGRLRGLAELRGVMASFRMDAG